MPTNSKIIFFHLLLYSENWPIQEFFAKYALGDEVFFLQFCANFLLFSTQTLCHHRQTARVIALDEQFIFRQ